MAITLILALLCPAWRPADAQAEPCPEPNDDLASACPLGDGASARGTLERPDDRDAYRIVVDAGLGEIRLELTDLPADYDLYLMDAGNRVLGQSVHEGQAPEQLQLAVQPGTYFAFVQADPSREVAPASPYTLRVTVVGATGQPAAPPPAPMAAPAAPPAAPDSRRVLLSDTFDDPQRGYLPSTSFNPTREEIGYIDGEYSIRNIDPQNGSRGTGTSATYGDATLAVDVRLIGNPGGRRIMIGCRSHQSNIPERPNSYTLAVIPDAQAFHVNRWEGVNRTELVRQQTSPAIRPDNAWNRVEFGCVGQRITVRVNDVDLASVEDGAISRGTFYIVIAGPGAEIPHAEARLDNLVIYGP